MNKKKLLALLMALVMTLSLMPMTVIAEELETVTPIAEPIEPAVESVSFEAANAVALTSIDVDGTDTSVYTVSDGFYQDGETYTKSTNFYITSKEGLEYFRDLVNAKKTVADSYVRTWAGYSESQYVGGFYSNNFFSGKTVHLLSDIDLANNPWMTIGYNHLYGTETDYYDSTSTDTNNHGVKAVFYGNFNGHNHTISNLNVSNNSHNHNKSGYGEYGLFGYLAGSLTIRNLTIHNATVDLQGKTGSYDYIGAFVGNAGSSTVTFENCHLTGNVAISSTYYAGGFTGMGNVYFNNCSVVGENGSQICSPDYYAGGLTGCIRSAGKQMPTSCSVSGIEIVADYAGGLIGLNNSYENSTFGTCSVTNSTINGTTNADVEYGRPIKEENEGTTLSVSNVTIVKPAPAVAQIGDNQYPTLAEAFVAAGTNATTIQLIGNISDMTTVEVAANQNITLDLNGHSIATAVKNGSGTDTRHYYAIDNYGTFTLKDSAGNGKIEARGIENLENGVMTIDGGKIVAVDANGGAAIWNEATLEFKGGTLEATYSGEAVGSAGPGCLNNSGTAHIYSGTFTDASVRCYAICNFGDLTIEDATVNGVHGALACDYGTLVVNGGSYTASNYYGLWITNDGDITDVTVNGGNFRGGETGKNAIRASVDDGKQDVSDATIRITGGTFTGDGTSAAAVAMNESNSVHSWGMAISGGTFSTEPDASYIAEGHAAIASGGVWIVKPVVTTSNESVVTVDTSSSYTVDTSSVNADDSVKTSISGNTNVTGVKLSTSATVPATENSEEKSGLQAVVDKAKAGNSNITATDATAAIDEATSIDVDVKVTVTPTAYTNDNTAQTATFKLEPKATVTATKTVENADPDVTIINDVEVTNDMIDQLQDITVNIYTGFLPAQIIHRADTGEIIDVFNAGQFNYANGVATVTIHHFSTLEASADSGVAAIGTKKYATLAEAFAEAQDGQTITLLQNIELTERLFVNAGDTPIFEGNGRYATTSENKSITLDLNGKNITSTSNIALAGGSLNITGTGTISTSASGLAPVEIRGTGDLASKRTLTIGSGVTLEGEEYGLNVFGSNDAQKNLIDVTVHGTVNGTLFVLGNLKNTENAINIVVDGTVNGGNEEVGIALNGYGSVTVNNPANVSGKTGIEVRAGKLTVNGGTITGKGAYEAPTHNGSGTTSSGAAVAVAQHSTKLPIDVTLTGGNLSATGANGKAVVVADPEGNETIAESVQVVATESFKNNSSVDEDYEWVVTSGNNYTLQEKPVKVLGGSLRMRATNGGNGTIVYNETDLRFGFKVNDSNYSTQHSYFTYRIGTGDESDSISATNKATDGTTNLVLKKVPASYFNTAITVTLHAKNSSGGDIGTFTLTKSVKDVAFALRDGGESISPTWKNYAGEIISINGLSK